MILLNTGLILFAYLLGSISSALIVSKIMKLPDPRMAGSKNPGATNVLRLSGKKAAIITLIGDILKGFIPVLAGRLLGVSELVLALTALAAVAGHVFPVFLNFKGGKGVATAFGGIIMLSWPLGLAGLIAWIIIAGLFRYSSLASICTVIFIPVVAWFLLDKVCVIPLLLISLLILFRHKDNIVRIIQGKESKIGKRDNEKNIPDIEKHS